MKRNEYMSALVVTTLLNFDILEVILHKTPQNVAPPPSRKILTKLKKLNNV